LVLSDFFSKGELLIAPKTSSNIEKVVEIIPLLLSAVWQK
jgi:hypothetical protein